MTLEMLSAVEKTQRKISNLKKDETTRFSVSAYSPASAKSVHLQTNTIYSSNNSLLLKRHQVFYKKAGH